MKRYLLIIIILLGIFCSNIMVFAQENESEAYEITTEEDSELSSNSDITNEELENAIIIGSGEEEQISILFLDGFAAYYFSQLNKNFGNNYIGSCSYTAAAMLLSFYDTYWNDNIIPEHYESQDKNFPNTKLIEDISESPGIKMESIPHGTTKEQYKTIIDNDKDEYFHLKLIDIGLNIFDDYALFPSSVEELLEYYLYNVVGFSTSEVTVERITAGNLFDGITVREYVINKVTQGIPVFVSATSLGEGAHSYIIYDYDASTDELYCHLGGHYNDENVLLTHVKFSTIDYTLFEGAVTINFTQNSQHSHSDNYVDSEGNTYCSCYFSNCHPEHEHRYKPFESTESTLHTYDCPCSPTTILQPHTYTYAELDDNMHIYKCTKCEYQIEQNHRWEKTYNDETHTFTCIDCGHVKTDFHNIEIESCDSTAHRYYCTGCDYSVAEEHIKTHTSVDDILHFVKCSVCEYEGNEYHSTKYADLGDGTHSDSCEECGYYSIENHTFVCKSVDGTYHRSVCDACGLVNGANEAHVWGSYSNPKYFKCTLCGHLKLVTGPGIIPINPPNKNDEIEETE